MKYQDNDLSRDVLTTADTVVQDMIRRHYGLNISACVEEVILKGFASCICNIEKPRIIKNDAFVDYLDHYSWKVDKYLKEKKGQINFDAADICKIVRNISNDLFKEADDIFNACDEYEVFASNVMKLAFRMGCCFFKKLQDDGTIRLIIGSKINKEKMMSRNFRHYINYKLEDNGYLYDMSELKLDEEEREIYPPSELEENISYDCWEKKISLAGENGVEHFIILLAVEDGVVTDMTYVEDEVQQFGGGMLFIPGMQMPERHRYWIAKYNDIIGKEIETLYSNKLMPNGFSFIGKPLHKRFLKENGETFAKQYAFRSAYSHISFDVDDNGLVTEMTYSTYQSSGSGYGDMFSRPQLIDDRADEAMDLMLDVFDYYTNDELDALK